jgi:hypothetical protein
MGQKQIITLALKQTEKKLKNTQKMVLTSLFYFAAAWHPLLNNDSCIVQHSSWPSLLAYANELFPLNTALDYTRR